MGIAKGALRSFGNLCRMARIRWQLHRDRVDKRPIQPGDPCRAGQDAAHL